MLLLSTDKHKLELKDNSLDATLDGHPYRLPHLPRRAANGGWWVAGSDLRQTLGLTWEYDAEKRELTLKP